MQELKFNEKCKAIERKHKFLIIPLTQYTESLKYEFLFNSHNTLSELGHARNNYFYLLIYSNDNFKVY